MSSQINLFLENFIEDIDEKIKANLDKAKKATLERIVKDTDEYVPYKSGDLSSNVSINPSNSSFTYEEDYASYAFNPISPKGVPKQYTHTVHKNAQGHPFEKSASEHEVEWIEVFRKELMNDVESE
jgi:hypothetical protein